MEQYELYQTILTGVFVAALLFLLLLLFIHAPYGHDRRAGWGPTINPRLAWVIWEFPAFFCFGYFFFTGNNYANLIPIIFCLLWEIHYTHRTFIYPFTIRVEPGETSPLFLALLAMSFNGVNGYLNGTFLSNYADHLLSIEWLWDIRFMLGALLFIGGFAIAKHSDATLKSLRKPGEGGYKIPYGGMFKWVSCPNYLGELTQWLGFAIASWSLPGLAFVAFATANLLPRALSNHRFYHENFKEQYPKERKALIPFVL